MSADATLTHILVAAGSGSRHGGTLPKQYLPLPHDGRPMLMTAIERLRLYGCGGEVILVLSPDMEPLWRDLCREHAFASPRTVYGGETRWHSVRNGLAQVTTPYVTVHDAARPLLPEGLVPALLEALQTHHGAVPVVDVTDTVRYVDPDGTSRPLPRHCLRAVQTPQAFRTDTLRSAYDMPRRDTFTDDASVLEAAGYTDIALVPGSPALMKVTYPGDILTLLERL